MNNKDKMEKITLKKDFIFNIDNIEYKILNVPFEKFDVDGEEFVNLDVAIKIEIALDLMLSNKIPNEIDFEESSEIKL